MKSTVEKLSPTRVRINVEVPFTELQPDFDRAYKQLAQQVRLPGFRPGKAPAKLLEAVSAAARCSSRSSTTRCPAGTARPSPPPRCVRWVSRTSRSPRSRTARNGLHRRGRRAPRHRAARLSELKIEVDPIQVSDEDVDAELQSLRARFGTLKGVERPAAEGDFVSIDLSATVDGEDVPEASTEGLSHEVGSVS